MNATDGGTCVLRTRGLRKEYGREAGLVRAVDEVDLDVARGETVAVMGPSGCGKSTLLYLLGGLDRPSAGEIWVDGQDITRLSERALARLRRDAIGFVFQAFHLMDELTAVENQLHQAGQTLVIVTHDTRIAATADRMIAMRDGAFIDQTRLQGGTTGSLASLAGLEG